MALGDIIPKPKLATLAFPLLLQQVKNGEITVDAPCLPAASSSAPGYVTSIGRMFRSFGLDERPQFFNIWNGIITFIGRRLCFASEVEFVKRR
jgi:hypothetical protein